jgi:hypothetical protein
MLGSFDGRDVVGREKGILRVPVRQGTGLGSPARGTAGTGSAACCGGAGDAVLEELLIFAPPVLPEQRFTRLFPGAAARHDPVLSVGCGRGKHVIMAAIGAVRTCKSYLNQITKAVNSGLLRMRMYRHPARAVLAAASYQPCPPLGSADVGRHRESRW